MTSKSLSEQMSKLVSSNAGIARPLSEEDKTFATIYREAVSTLSPDLQILTFKNVIRNSGGCGFAGGGAYQYLVNTNGGARYRVTVRTFWRQGINSGQFDDTYISEAGGSQSLGCTDSGAIPVAYYNREVVGEVPI